MSRRPELLLDADVELPRELQDPLSLRGRVRSSDVAVSTATAADACSSVKEGCVTPASERALVPLSGALVHGGMGAAS